VRRNSQSEIRKLEDHRHRQSKPRGVKQPEGNGSLREQDAAVRREAIAVEQMRWGPHNPFPERTDCGRHRTPDATPVRSFTTGNVMNYDDVCEANTEEVLQAQKSKQKYLYQAPLPASVTVPL